MKTNLFAAIGLVFATVTFTAFARAQANTQPPDANPMYAITNELVSISNSVKTLNQNMKVFLDRLGGAPAANDKQQKMLIGLQILNQAEQRLATLQKLQIDLAEKQASTRGRLVQIEQELRPESIDRSVTFAGTTKTDELRDSKRRALEVERAPLRELGSQLDMTILQTNSDVREALALVAKLRKRYLVQIEQQLSEQ
jgi:hypothetical protein